VEVDFLEDDVRRRQGKRGYGDKGLDQLRPDVDDVLRRRKKKGARQNRRQVASLHCAHMFDATAPMLTSHTFICYRLCPSTLCCLHFRCNNFTTLIHTYVYCARFDAGDRQLRLCFCGWGVGEFGQERHLAKLEFVVARGRVLRRLEGDALALQQRRRGGREGPAHRCR
jgi:hypothetical protein